MFIVIEIHSSAALKRGSTSERRCRSTTSVSTAAQVHVAIGRRKAVEVRADDAGEEQRMRERRCDDATDAVEFKPMHGR